MRLQFQCVQRYGPQAVHSCTSHKHTFLGQAWVPRRIQNVKFRPDVEQNKEVDTTPGTQEGQDRVR